ALRLTTARYFTPSGRSIQAKGISPDIEVLQEVPEELKARTDTRGEASLRGHLKAEGDEQTGSQSYIPPDPKDDKALHTALDLIPGIQKNSAYPPNTKPAVPNEGSAIAHGIQPGPKADATRLSTGSVLRPRNRESIPCR